MTHLQRKNRLVALMGIMLVGMMLLFGAAAVDTATASHSNNTQLNQTLDVTNDTETIWVDTTDTNNTDLHVFIEGVDSNGNVTELKNTTVNSGANITNTTTYQLTDSDRSSYEKVRIRLEGDYLESHSYGSYVSVSGSGSVSSSGSWFTETNFGVANWILTAIVVIVAGMAWVGGKDDY